MQEHLKKRKLEQPVFESSKNLNIQQQRELVKRESGVSVWKLVLPRYNGRGADPIVEYRNSHRILFAKKVPEVSNGLYTFHVNCFEEMSYLRTYFSISFRMQQFNPLARV